MKIWQENRTTKHHYGVELRLINKKSFPTEIYPEKSAKIFLVKIDCLDRNEFVGYLQNGSSKRKIFVFRERFPSEQMSITREGWRTVYRFTDI